MNDFTIKVYDEGNGSEPSDMEVIGRAISALAAEGDTLAADPKVMINRSKDIDDYLVQRASWSDTARAAADEIFTSLSFKMWEGQEVVKEVDHNDTPETEDVHEYVTLKFVFEDANEMIVPVPSDMQIERGKANAPIMPSSAYARVVTRDTIEALQVRLKQALSDEINAPLSDLTDAQINALGDMLAKVATDMTDELKGDVPTFYAQLADYSVRQCAS